MDGRHASEHAVAQVQRRARGRIPRRHQRRRPVADVGDDADAVAEVEPARGLGNVGGGKVEAEKALRHLVAVVLGHDLAVPVGIEAVHHHAVDAEQAAGLARKSGAQRLDRRRAVQRRERRPHRPIRPVPPGRRLGGRRLELHDQPGRILVRDGVEQGARQFHQHRHLKLALVGLARGARDLVEGLGRQPVRDRPPDHAVGRDAQKGAGVGAGLANGARFGVEDEQQPVRLHGTRRVDGLAVAGGLRDGDARLEQGEPGHRARFGAGGAGRGRVHVRKLVRRARTQRKWISRPPRRGLSEAGVASPNASTAAR